MSRALPALLDALLVLGFAAVGRRSHAEGLDVAGASTVVVGMLLRRVTGEGTAWSFVLVATVVLTAPLLGWRLVARWLS